MASGEQQIEGFDDLVAIGDLDAMVEQYYREVEVIDLDDVIDSLGHTSVQTTAVYVEQAI